MTNINREKEYDNLTDWFNFAFDQRMKFIFTMMPGLIVSYDAAKRRATVQLAIDRLKTDGTRMELPALVDVPTLFPSSKKFSIQFPLEKDDPVMVCFSSRDLSAFKVSYAQSAPQRSGGLFQIKDGVAIPGFGNLTNTPAKTDAITIQNAAGTTYVAVEENEVTAVGVQKVTATAPVIELNGNVTINGDVEINNTAPVQVSNGLINSSGDIVSGTVSLETHLHSAVTTGPDVSGPPV